MILCKYINSIFWYTGLILWLLGGAIGVTVTFMWCMSAIVEKIRTTKDGFDMVYEGYKAITAKRHKKQKKDDADEYENSMKELL